MITFLIIILKSVLFLNRSEIYIQGWISKLKIYIVLNFAFWAAVSPGMILDVSYNLEPTSQSGFLVINCSLDSSLTDLETVASLAVFGSRPYGSEGDLEQLAAVDLWSNTPKLVSLIHIHIFYVNIIFVYIKVLKSWGSYL